MPRNPKRPLCRPCRAEVCFADALANYRNEKRGIQGGPAGRDSEHHQDDGALPHSRSCNIIEFFGDLPEHFDGNIKTFAGQRFRWHGLVPVGLATAAKLLVSGSRIGVALRARAGAENFRNVMLTSPPALDFAGQSVEGR